MTSSNTSSDGWQTMTRRKSSSELHKWARSMQHVHNIHNLAATLVSNECVALYAQGWGFDSVLRPGDRIPEYDGVEYCLVDVKNKYSDRVVFAKDKIC